MKKENIDETDLKEELDRMLDKYEIYTLESNTKNEYYWLDEFEKDIKNIFEEGKSQQKKEDGLDKEDFNKCYSAWSSFIYYVTNGKMSKPNYTFEAMKEIYDEEREKREKKLVDEQKKEFEELIKRLCYCKRREGTLYSETKNGKNYCAFCWLKKQLESKT